MIKVCFEVPVYKSDPLLHIYEDHSCHDDVLDINICNSAENPTLLGFCEQCDEYQPLYHKSHNNTITLILLKIVKSILILYDNG